MVLTDELKSPLLIPLKAGPTKAAMRAITPITAMISTRENPEEGRINSPFERSEEGCLAGAFTEGFRVDDSRLLHSDKNAKAWGWFHV